MSWLSNAIGGVGAALNPVGFIGTLAAGAGAGLDYMGAREQRKADLQQAREQMAFQERMSSTAHQREVTDLRAAGLNPILSANGGASSPVGAGFDPENMMEGTADKVVSSALDSMRLRKDIKEADARIENMKEDSKLKAAQNLLVEAQRNQVRADTDKTVWGSVVMKNRAEIEKKHPKFFGWLDAILNRANPSDYVGLGLHKNLK